MSIVRGIVYIIVECLIFMALLITFAGALWAMSIAARSAYHYWRSK